MTKHYAYHEWVVPQERNDRNGNKSTKPFLVPIFPKAREPLPSDACHPAKETYDITPSYVLAWIGIIIICGAHYCDCRNQRKPWMNAPFGNSMSYI